MGYENGDRGPTNLFVLLREKEVYYTKKKINPIRQDVLKSSSLV